MPDISSILNMPIPTHDFWLGVLVAVGLIALAKRNYLYYLAMFPGTFLHEISHFVVALLVGARPRFTRLLPSKSKSGDWELGSVTSNKSLLFGSFIAMAPFALHFLIVPAYVYTLNNLDGWWAIGAGYVTAVGTWAAMPSGPDFKNALTNPISTALLIAVCYFGYSLYTSY